MDSPDQKQLRTAGAGTQPLAARCHLHGGPRPGGLPQAKLIFLKLNWTTIPLKFPELNGTARGLGEEPPHHLPFPEIDSQGTFTPHGMAFSPQESACPPTGNAEGISAGAGGMQGGRSQGRAQLRSLHLHLPAV